MTYDEIKPPTVAIYTPQGLQRREVHYYDDQGRGVPVLRDGERLHESAGGHWIVEQQEEKTHG